MIMIYRRDVSLYLDDTGRDLGAGLKPTEQTWMLACHAGHLGFSWCPVALCLEAFCRPVWELSNATRMLEMHDKASIDDV